jgi:hypothetical protein
MQTNKIVTMAGRGFILLSAFSFLSVSLMAFNSPQAVMDLVQVKLTNTDAFSSIRGIYGGVGLALAITLVYMLVKAPRQGLMFLALIWGLYALSRVITIFSEGALGAFGTQWLAIESVFCGIALLLLWATPRPHNTTTA